MAGNKKLYVNVGLLRNALQHCEDDDEVWVELVDKRRSYVEEMIEDDENGGASFGQLRARSVYIEGGCSSSEPNPRYEGTCTIFIEWDEQRRNEFLEKKRIKEAENGI